LNATEILVMAALVVWTLVGIGLLAAFVTAIPMLARLEKSLRSLDRLMDVLDRNVEPILHRVQRISDDLSDITASLRSDVDAIGETVERGTRSTERILDRAERRAAEIDGLLELIQEEVEESFLGIASALRGVRGLSERLGLGGRRGGESST
jgi:uncharacterized protein YoxC